MKVLINKGVPGFKPQTDLSAGADLHAMEIVKSFDVHNTEESILNIGQDNIYLKQGYYKLYPGERALVKTGISVLLDKGYEAQVRPRSGKTLKTGLMVLNSPGTIDADYTSEIAVILFNPTEAVIEIDYKERIAQLVVSKVFTEFEETNEALFSKMAEKRKKESNRKGGFGSTGK